MARERNSECWYNEVCNMDNLCTSCVRFIEMQYLMENSGLPKAKQRPIPLSCSDEDYEAFMSLQDIKDDVVNFVNNGENLFIGGTIGSGKTSWSIKILLKYFDEVWPGNGFRVRGMFVHVPTLLSKLKDFDNPLLKSYKDNLSKADLIIWDEIGGAGMSNYDYTQLLTYIDQRSLNEKSNIYTANIDSAKNCEKYLGSKLTSRVWNSATVVILNGRDRR